MPTTAVTTLTVRITHQLQPFFLEEVRNYEMSQLSIPPKTDRDFGQRQWVLYTSD